MLTCGLNLAYGMGWLDRTESENQVRSWISIECIVSFVFAVLMSVLGNNILVGLPQNVRILHIAQLEEVTSGRTILQEILSADTDRSRIIKEAQGSSTIFNPQWIDLPCTRSLAGLHRKFNLGRRLEHSHPWASAFSGTRCSRHGSKNRHQTIRPKRPHC